MCQNLMKRRNILANASKSMRNVFRKCASWGKNRVTTTKELNRFAEKGWIRLGYREILVKGGKALRRYGSQKKQRRRNRA